MGVVRDFGDYVTEGRELLASRNTNSWQLGDLLVDAVRDLEIKPGRPTDENAITLSDLAREMDVETPRASEWLSVAQFYPANVRTAECSWSHYNMARRASNGSAANALELLATAQALHLGIAAFRRYIKGEYFEGYVERHELPPRLQAILPSAAPGVWVVMKRAQEAA
jgi:hypothetical protein